MNHVMLMGRITKDIELRKVGQDISTCNFTIAVNKDFKTNGKYEADFIPCKAWKNTADFISKHFSKGSQILVLGRIETGNYKNKEGQTIYTTDVVVEKAYFTESKKKESVPANVGDAFEIDDEDVPF